MVSLAVHGVILFLLLRHGARWLGGAGDAAGPRGGGGGGTAAAVRYVELPAASPPAPEPVPPAVTPPVSPPVPAMVVPDLKMPQPNLAVSTRLAITVASPALSGPGTGGGPGSGPGSGGGIGAGVGTGVGNDSGPGRGGPGEYITPAYPRTVLLPADCARGRFTVQFWVEADGHVSRIAIDPLPKDAGCRREMREKMMGYRFLPARTRDGRAVASVYPMHYTR